MKAFLCVLLLLSANCIAVEPYTFSPSNLGKNFKRFTHNYFGFSIDMPENWTFGVLGQPPTVVIFLFPEGMNAAKFSPEFQQIEIGEIPLPGITVAQAHDYIMKGMRQGHPDFAVVTGPTSQKLNGIDSLYFAIKWESKAGFPVTERISLVPYKDRILSVTSRAVDQASGKLRDRIISTFRPLDPQF